MAIELLIKAILTDRGFLVSEPVLSTSYDFITEWDGVINTIQVKSTQAVSKPTKVHNGGYYKVEAPTVVGGYSILLAHVAPIKTTFVIPWQDVDRRWICIHTDRVSRYEKFKEKWSLLKEAH